MNRTEQQVEALVTPVVTALGCSVWGVEYLSQGKHSKLRIYIDKPGGVTVDDCAQVSHHVSDLLDTEDPISASYQLEVSSPGMDCILFKTEQYEACVGEQVDLRLNYPFEGRKRFVGRLNGVASGEAIVQVDDMEYILPIENVRLARVVPQFD